MSETGAEHDNRGSPAAPASVDPLVGKMLSGRFRLVRLVARGGMGKIYEATQEPLGRTVALKVLDIHDAGDEFRRRFFLEAAHCARLSHPNTVRIYDYGETDDGIYYIAMEFLKGHTLHHLIEASAPLEPLRAIQIARQICSALAEAHEEGIVHRDLKPANVFLTPHGDDPDFVKVVDFGLVKEMGKESELSRTGHVLGSPLYMAPEQIHNTHVDQRTDIYALGLILYAMLTGRTAFKRGNPLAVLMAQANAMPPSFQEANPDVQVPASLEWLVQTCIAKGIDERPGSMFEVLRALKACAKEIRGETGPLKLGLQDGLIVLPDGLDVSEEIRLGSGADGALSTGTTTLVQKSGSLPAGSHTADLEQTSRTRAIVLVGTTGALAMVGAGMVLVGLALGLFWLLFWNPGVDPEPAREPVVAAPPPVEEPAVVAPVEEQPAAKVVEVALTSEPEGADVERDGVFLGTTPFTVRMDEGDAWVVQVKASGHTSRTVRLASDQPQLHVRLDRARPTQGAAARPAPAPRTVEPPAAPAPEPQPQRRGDIRNPWD